jgi:hypothetical protein
MLKDWQKRLSPTIVSALVVAVAVLAWGRNRGFVTQSAAVFALLLALPGLVRGLRPRLSERVRRLRPEVRGAVGRYAPFAIVVIGTLFALGPVALGQMPVSQDHANHYFATHILVREMVASGRFFGWTDSLGTGYPFGDTYHTPSYLVTGLLALVSFGLVPLTVSYAFGIVLAWVVPAVAVTAWTRRIAGPVGATVAGLAFALDMGSDREGGWVYAMFHGVWTQHIGAGVWVLALLALFRLVEKPTTRRLAAAALTAGLALWIHPMNSVTLLIGAVLLFLIQYLMGPRPASDEDKQSTVMLVPALLAAGVIGLVWVLRMVLAGDVVFASVAYWESLQQLMAHLLEGELMENQLALISVLGLVGLIQLAAAGGRFKTFTLVLPAVCLLVGSMAVVLESDMGLAGGSLGIMQYRRFSVAAKPFWYAMSGAGITTVGLALKSDLAARVAARWPARVLLFAVFAPFLAAALSAVPGLFRSPVAMPLTAARTGDADNLSRIHRALEAEAKQCPKSGCRAVYFEKPGHGGLYPVISMADTGFAWLPTLTLPANNFEWINNTMDIDVMAKRGVSVVISKWPLEHERLEEIGIFGRHRLYRVAGARAVRAVVEEGPGRAKIQSWEPERRVIRLEGTDASTGLLVVQPPYRKWHAEQSGRALPIERRVEDGQVLSFIEGVRDGDLVLTYDDSLLENVMTALGVVLIVLCGIGLVAKPRPLPALLRGGRLDRAYHLLGLGASALVVLAVIGMSIGGKVAARAEWLSEEHPGTELRAVLHQRNPDDLRFAPAHYCVPSYFRNPEFGCSEHDLLPRLAAAARRQGKIPSCLSVGVPPKGSAALTFELPSGTTHLKGRLHHLSGGPLSGIAGTESLGKATRAGRPFELSVGPRQESITITLATDKQQARACLELVALKRP